MKRLLFLMVIASIIFSSCSGENKSVEPTVSPTVAFSETSTFTPIPTETPLPTVIPTQALSPDLNTYECAENVSKADCDFIKEGVRIARYFFINSFGKDVSRGVKFVIINDPDDISYGGGGSAGTHQVTKSGDSFIWVNVGLRLWTENLTPGFQASNLGLIIHEFTHEWQWQLGCNADSIKGAKQPTSFMIEGYAGYAGRIASGVDVNDYMFSDAQAQGFWQASQWNEEKWFGNSDVNLVVVKHLVDAYGIKVYTKYCEAVGRGGQPNDAFQSVYGLPVLDFREKFKDVVLGSLKDCTVATCGAGVDNYSDKYKLKHLIDNTKSTPNLILNFVDENNLPVSLTHLSLWRQNFGGDGQVVDYAQPFETTPTFSAALLPGRYIFAFCEPGYPVDHADGACQWHETEWIDVYDDQVTNMTIPVFPGVQKTDLATPDFEIKFTDKDGNPIGNLAIQLCNYDTPVKVCTLTYPIEKTDANGVYKDSLRSGKYLIRIPLYPGYLGKYDFAPFYEIRDINVNEASLTSIAYQFPVPNLVVKFLDVNGSPIPEHGFDLCKVIAGKGDCTTPVSLWGPYTFANKNGVFEAHVDPGEYYILTCKLPDCSEQDTITITGIIVVSESEVTTVEYPLYK